MYKILEEMVDNALKGNEKEVKELNKAYETLVPEVYPSLSDDLESDYDNCRHNCILIFNKTFSFKKNEFIADIKIRFNRIKKYEKNN